MSVSIDWSKQITAETRAAESAEARRIVVNAECQRRIFAVASPNDQRNMGVVLGLIAATPVSDRTNEQVEILSGCAAALAWVNEMRASAAVLRENASDYTLDAMWPEVPASVLSMLDLI